MTIALDATYSIGHSLSGVGLYSREMLFGLAAEHPEHRFRFCYRPHRLLRAVRQRLPANAARGLLGPGSIFPPGADLFHGLNQRLPAKRFRRSVCTFHDLFVMTGQYSSAEFRERFTIQAREAAERADLIITVSAFTAQQVENLLAVERSRLRVIHHGVRELPIPDLPREAIVLSVGAIQERKNTRRIVEAFETLPAPWRLILAGSPDGYGAVEILQRVRTSRASERICVTGYVSEEELGSLYAQAAVFLFPSLDEGFGMPVLEAMRAGLPVIASDRSALPEVCGDAALLVNPESSDEIADALRRVTEDRQLSGSLARAGRERIREFSWRTAVQKTWTVYEELL